MSLFVLFLIANAGVNSLIMPFSPIGVTTSFSLARNEEAIFYNPANLQADENFRLACFYNRFYVATQSFSLALSKRIKTIDFGWAISNFDYGDIEWHPDYPTEDTLINYSANDFAVIMGGSVNVTSAGRIGLNIKYVYENIYSYADNVIAFDLAFAYQTSHAGITFGAANLGSRLTINSEEVNLPARISLGGLYKSNSIVVSSEIRCLINNDAFEMGFGFSFPLYRAFELNGAVNYREDFYPGFGVVIYPGNLVIRYGGAIYPNDLGMINTLGIGLEF